MADVLNPNIAGTGVPTVAGAGVNTGAPTGIGTTGANVTGAISTTANNGSQVNPDGSTTLTIPTGMVGLRSAAEGLGYQVGYNPQNKNPIINGQELDIQKSGLQNIGGHYYGDTNSIMGLLKPITQNPSSYQSPYAGQEKALIDQMNQPFSYNPNTDTALKQAQGEATQNTMESMNERGILNSTVTADRVAQEVQKLIPAYEQQAYTRYQGEQQRLTGIANLLMKMDDNSYQKYKDGIDQNFKVQQQQYQKQQDAIAQKQKELENTWERVKNLGYVDNAASLALKIKPGTRTAAAQQFYDNQAFELQKAKQQNQYQMQQIAAEGQKQKEILAYTDRLKSTPGTAAYAESQSIINSRAQGGANSQSTVNFNDIQSSLKTYGDNLFKSFAVKDNDTASDTYGQTIQKYGRDSVPYIAGMGTRIDSLLTNGMINQNQANQLSEQYLGKPWSDTVHVANYSQAVDYYGAMDKTQAKKEITANKSSIAPQMGDYYYKALLNKYK